MNNPVKNPSHYDHPSGVQCKDISKYLSCMLGSAFKYVWRAGSKATASRTQDLLKAIECLEIEATMEPDCFYSDFELIRPWLERVLAAETNPDKAIALEAIALANSKVFGPRRSKLDMAKAAIQEMIDTTA